MKLFTVEVDANGCNFVVINVAKMAVTNKNADGCTGGGRSFVGVFISPVRRTLTSGLTRAMVGKMGKI